MIDDDGYEVVVTSMLLGGKVWAAIPVNWSMMLLVGALSQLLLHRHRTLLLLKW